ncbi:MAG: PAS domain S-box protein [Luteimonas sp.]
MLTEQNEQIRNDDRFRLAMQSSGIGMAIVDVDGRWVEANPALERMLGYGSGELAGRTTIEVTHPDDIAISREYLIGLIDGSIPALDAQKRYLRRNGDVLWAHVNVAAMRDADGRAAYLIAQVRDISAQHEAEQALQAMNASLQQHASERSEELQASHRQQELFAYGISHDLRAPLRAIDSFAGLLAARVDGRLDDTERDYLNRIRGATGRMAGLIDALLDLSRATRAELKLETVDLSLLAEWVYAELADAEPDRVADVDVQSGLRAYGDERMLKLLLRQIVHNAWKFSRDRDRVRIIVTGERRGDRIVLSVRDEGVGFDMRYADKLFQPFHRLHGPEQAVGSGIGLAVARCIVERHHGRVWGESQPGGGSVFHVELPADETP